MSILSISISKTYQGRPGPPAASWASYLGSPSRPDPPAMGDGGHMEAEPMMGISRY